ncbi:penicillin-binding transpeptidase domain-containing protein [Halalkalibacter akibai]|uniref:serine-type D-Ala-D-Ala carboxypeptidase n=1 Tax=Halalkalibacter akibai (strain ATCC 43226 / DSM 21942 / CIP 109018 / JCM 9157 / 1139) TaxID=1236973 RepID=W4QSP5_HALA3|nr:penicillin-binding transpeptidase domain-containing protein [Halalkalibacter akibai]GAE34658.1 penicillin-binding protein 3 [Halalkalibacter akibai JCM 9157]
MRKETILIFHLFMIIVLLIGCSNETQPPDEVFEDFSLAWKQGNYDVMYEFLSTTSKTMISEEEFIQLYTNTYEEIQKSNLDVELIIEDEENLDLTENEIVLPFVKNISMFTGDMDFESFVSLSLDEENNEWKVDWSPSLVFPMMVEGDQVKLRVLYPSQRGEIFDRNGMGLAINGEIYEIGVVPGRIEDEESELKQLSDKIDVSEDYIIGRMNQSWVGEETFVPIKKVALDQETFVEEVYQSIPFATYRKVPARVYPAGKAAAHLTGYLQMVTAEEVEEDTTNFYTNQSQIGRAGLEALFEERLRGMIGGEIYIEGEDGNQKDVIQRNEAVNGETIRLTIDASLQQAIFNKLNQDKDSGTSVALDPVTGEVLSLVNSPAYDPNEFILGMSKDRFDQLQHDEKRPLTNRFSQSFIPGSTIKPITAAVALKNGLDPDKKISSSDEGWQKDPSWGNHLVRRVSNPLTELNLFEAMLYSDNIYFAKIATDLGIDVFQEGFDHFGFGNKLPFVYGFAESKLAVEEIDSDVLLADTAYGQGEMLVNPLHLALMYSTFVNSGSISKPLLLLDEQQELWKESVVSEEHSDIVLQSMIAVVNNSQGTASHAKLDQMMLAGKTGTAEHKETREVDEAGAETGWFVAVDADQPDLLMLMMIENVNEGNRGSSYVVTKVKELFQEYSRN